MIEVPIDEIVQRWTPQTDLSPLVNIKNKYFYQTNVLGEFIASSTVANFISLQFYFRKSRGNHQKD